jgi:hypothetical protein
MHSHFCPLFAAAKFNAKTFSQHKLKAQVAVLSPDSSTYFEAVYISSQKAGTEREPIKGVTCFTLVYSNYSFL